MSVVRKNISLAANATNPNLLTGLVEEFVSRPSAIHLYASQVTANAIELDLQVQNTSIAKDMIPNVQAAGTLNRNTDLLATTVGSPGNRIQLRAKNTTAGAVVGTFMLEIAELA